MLRLKHRDLAAFVPKLYGITVDELLRALFGLVIAVAKEVYAVLNVTVPANDISPIPVHGAAQRCAKTIHSMATTKAVSQAMER
jgi:hypothetical protein